MHHMASSESAAGDDSKFVIIAGHGFVLFRPALIFVTFMFCIPFLLEAAILARCHRDLDLRYLQKRGSIP